MTGGIKNPWEKSEDYFQTITCTKTNVETPLKLVQATRDSTFETNDYPQNSHSRNLWRTQSELKTFYFKYFYAQFVNF